MVDRATTIFVNLHRFPRTVEAVQNVVTAIRNRRIEEIGGACEWPEDLVRAGDWSPVQWLDPELAHAARRVRQAPGMVPLREIFEIGPPGRSTHDEFERVTDGSPHPDHVPVFDSVSSRLRVSLAGEPDAFWRSRPAARRRRPAKAGLVDSHLSRAGWVLLAQRARTNNASVVAVCSREKSLGTGFIPVVTSSVQEAKAVCVFWNSTPTLLQLLNMRSKMLMYPKWSVVQLEAVNLPEPMRTTEASSRLAAVYDRFSRERLKPWAYADADPVRREIDEAAAEVCEIPTAILADWRERLAKEPTVANRSPV